MLLHQNGQPAPHNQPQDEENVQVVIPPQNQDANQGELPPQQNPQDANPIQQAQPQNNQNLLIFEMDNIIEQGGAQNEQQAQGDNDELQEVGLEEGELDIEIIIIVEDESLPPHFNENEEESSTPDQTED